MCAKSEKSGALNPAPAARGKNTSTATGVWTDGARLLPGLLSVAVDEKPTIRVAAGVLEDASGRVLIARRRAGSHLEGWWEFPGGKMETGEGPREALVRELDEELGITVEGAEPLVAYRHEYPERVVELSVWQVRGYRGKPVGLQGQPLRWVSVAELLSAGLLPADQPIVDALMERGQSPRGGCPPQQMRSSK